jgi:hypothetical protein
MDPRAEINKIWKDVQASAREFASYSLQMSSRALDVAATRLKSLETNLKERAEKLGHTEKPGDGEKPAATDK